MVSINPSIHPMTLGHMCVHRYVRHPLKHPHCTQLISWLAHFLLLLLFALLLYNFSAASKKKKSLNEKDFAFSTEITKSSRSLQSTLSTATEIFTRDWRRPSSDFTAGEDGERRDTHCPTAVRGVWGKEGKQLALQHLDGHLKRLTSKAPAWCSPWCGCRSRYEEAPLPLRLLS